ncbi:MAG TPA: 30S ribosome-binding factor RbfA [Myxococcota bacterium]|nr:30S ribosome-binding factor RbfA [Myxococcota bacterium]
MKGIRPQRVAELVHRELAVLLRTDIKDPRVGDVSITHIQVTGDLRQARVYVTSLGGGGDDKQMLRGLQSAARFLRGRVGRALKLRHAPELEFRLDEGLDHSVELTAMLGRMEADRQARESSEDAEDSADAEGAEE